MIQILSTQKKQERYQSQSGTWTATCHYMSRVKLWLVDEVSGGFHVTRGSHVDKSDFDRTVHVIWILIGRPTNMQNLKKKLRTGREHVDTWHVDTWQILIVRSTFTDIANDDGNSI